MEAAQDLVAIQTAVRHGSRNIGQAIVVFDVYVESTLAGVFAQKQGLSIYSILRLTAFASLSALKVATVSFPY